MKGAFAVTLLALVGSLVQAASPNRLNQVRRETSGGSSVVSPSVLASYSLQRDSDGALAAEILILWRGSPGWSMRRTMTGSSMGGGSLNRDGIVNLSVRVGGLDLTASYDSRSRTATILGERVELKDANVVLVDKVDSPDGPIVLKTTTAAPTRDVAASVGKILRDSPELLSYLRCEAQIPEPMNQVPMAAVCTEAIVRGLIKTSITVTPVPTGPVTNRAAATGPAPQPERPDRPGPSSGNGTLSPAAVGGWFVHREPTGAVYLDLLVVWRGSAGWMLSLTSGASSGGGMSDSRRGMTLHYGDRSFYAALNTISRTVEIDDSTVPLNDDNVVLVDDVDSPNGLRVVKTLRIDPKLSDAHRVDEAIARSPELISYLRCDLKLSDQRVQAAMNILCARYIRK